MALLLLDSASLYYRSYFALPESMTAPDGTPVNAVRGFLDTVSAMVRERESTSVIACWDVDWRPAWRVDLVPSYKTHRVAVELTGDAYREDGSVEVVEEVPDTLAPQVDIIRRLLPLVGIPVAGAEDAEADDVIATLCVSGVADIASGDRDLLQLVSDDTTVLFTGGTSASRGGRPWQEFTPDIVREKYGVTPQHYADLAILRGDPSDGLPGVKGIGEKTAVSLINAYGGIQDIVRAARDESTGRPLTPAVRRKLLEAEGDLPAFDRVVRLAPVKGFTPPSPLTPRIDAARSFADLWGVLRSVDRLLDVFG
jgi:5'-3' exonuclease